MAEANQPIVIDNGSGVMKAGLAGGDKPRVMFRSCVGRLKHPRVMPGGALEGTSDTLFIGSKVEEHRGALTVDYPMEHGIVQNWSDMERIWNYVYSKDNLNVGSEEHAVLLTEAPLNPYSHKEKTTEIFFEGFNIPAVYFAIQAMLSLYASGRTTGVVLDIGDGVSHVVPVYEGLVIPHAIQRIDVAGRDVTNQLSRLLRRSGYNFHTSAEREIVRNMKEDKCYVALNPMKLEEEYYSGQSGGSNNSANSTGVAAGSNTAASSSGAATGGATTNGKGPVQIISANGSVLGGHYTLPDGSTVTFGREIYQAPEILFQPDLLGYEYKGIHDLLITSIMKADIDLRKTLLSQIVLAGGSTMFHGFGERLLYEIRKHHLTPKESKIRIAAPPERMISTWIGGSILASLSTFKSMWISKKDYLEHGNRILHSKSW